MKLALVFGKSGETLKNRLKDVLDNLDIDIYDNIPRMIDQSIKRGSIYDRIIVMSTLLQSADLENNLYSYWSNTSKETEIILMCRKNNATDGDVAIRFMNTFNTPVASAMIVESTTINVATDAVRLRPTEITEKYGIKDFMTIELDTDEVKLPEPVKEEKPAQVAKTEPKKSEKKRKGLFEGLFTSKKIKETTVEATEIVQTDDNDVNIIFDESSKVGKTSFEESAVTDQGTSTSEQVVLTLVQSPTSTVPQSKPQICDISTTQLERNKSGVALGAVGAVVEAAVVVASSGKIEKDPSSDFSFDDSSNEFGTVEPVIVEENLETDVTTTSLDNIENTNFNFSDAPISVKQTDVFDEVIDEEIGAIIPEDSSFSKGIGVGEDVVDDFGQLDIAGSETAYRKANEQPKVIVKTEIKEVEKTVEAKSNVLSNVLSGRSSKVIIVTGDRCTGVTMTALTLVKEFSKSVPVLYFDCDIENHGLLNYINYETFLNYERSHLEGVKRFKSSKAVDSCIVGYDDNFDLLTSDFSCDATDADIEAAQGAVSEIARNYGVVVVDCPVSKLPYIKDLLLTGSFVLCIESSKRGFMNMLCQMENCDLPNRYKRNIVSKGMMFMTKILKDLDVKKLRKYISSIYQSEDLDWMSMEYCVFNGKLDTKTLNNILDV